jgi:protein involved in polysaccharide export with SLBB domain
MRPVLRRPSLAALILSVITLPTALRAAQALDAPTCQVLVTGEVRYPGRPTLTPSTMTVADALAAVGSPTPNAGDDVIVIRPMRPGGLPERVVIALADVEVGAAGLDLTLRDGDIVNVPQAKRYYVSGFVKNPGAYKLRRGTTIAQAILLVGGLADLGTVRGLRVVRKVNGKPVETSAKPDDVILPDDEIKVARRMF